MAGRSWRVRRAARETLAGSADASGAELREATAKRSEALDDLNAVEAQNRVLEARNRALEHKVGKAQERLDALTRQAEIAREVQLRYRREARNRAQDAELKKRRAELLAKRR